MIFFIVEWLRNTLGVKVPHAFLYTSSRAILAAITAMAVTFIFGKVFIKKLYELKIGQPIRDDAGMLLAELHKNKKNTPTMGGALIIFSVFVSLFLWMDLTHSFTWLLFFTMLVLGCLGGYDDYLKLRYKNAKGLSGRKKLLIQFAWACVIIGYLQFGAVSNFFESVLHLKIPIVKEFLSSPNEQVAKELPLFDYSSRLYFPFFKEPVLIFSGVGLFVLWAFFAFSLVGSSNAVNLTDGLDGLASGLVCFAAASIGIVAFLSNNMEMADYLNILYIEGSSEIAVFLSAIAGACLGFLWLNCHPAQVFMGDTGSLALGGALGVSAVLLRREFFYALVGLIFVAEALSVIMQVTSYRYFNKRRIFLCAPLHHHFEYLGWAETKVVTRFWIIGLLLSLIGLASLKFQ